MVVALDSVSSTFSLARWAISAGVIQEAVA